METCWLGQGGFVGPWVDTIYNMGSSADYLNQQKPTSITEMICTKLTFLKKNF